jgi:choline dehydrogenase-like flavoprotein
MSPRHYRDSHAVDFVIVGSGAAGGVIARELARANLSVVVLEQGPRLNPSDFEHDELKYWYAGGITNETTHSPQTFRGDAAQRTTQPLVRPSLVYARAVGGTTLHYTANYWRFREIDFRERSVLGAISGTGFADWPISYAELEPYYTKGRLGDRRFRPRRRESFRLSAHTGLSHAAVAGEVFRRAVRARRAQARPASRTRAARHQLRFLQRPPGCVHCGFCHGFACEVMAKASTLTTVIPQAEATGNCEVRPNSYVSRVEHDKRGRVTGVAYFDREGREHFQRARALVLAANGAETPRLLLNSASPAFPQGLANSSGMVGKHLMFNYTSVARGVFEHELNEFKSVQVSRILHDFYDSDPKRGFYGGGGLDARIGPQPTIWAQRIAAEGPGWGAALKERLREFPRSMQVACHGTSLPLETNNVTLDPELKDAWGIPAIRVTYRDHPDDLATARFLQDRGAEILDAAGALRVSKAPVNESTFAVHLLGTCRMGDDPAKSVVDRDHRSHDVPNLFICDGSSLVTSGRGQPTMTIQALAFRAGEHLAAFARKNQI